MYGPYLTMDQIKAQYPNEWVFLAKPTKNRQNEVTGGHVILHARDRAEYLRQVGEYPEIPDVHHFASQWTGDLYGRDVNEHEPETGAA
ncbi:MAG: hypothetical protein FJ304_26300 [Planctomycetes bacterium]|nr:hypothetical protein [Planctomycetota bacterium]